MFDDELDKITEALGGETLTDDEKLKLLDDARKAFEDIPGVQFSELSDDNDDENIIQDFKTTRNVLTKNVDRLEKITSIIFDSIAMMPENLKAIEIGMECITAQNNNLRLLSELKNKVLMNKSLAKKLKQSNGNDNGNGLPKGFTLK